MKRRHEYSQHFLRSPRLVAELIGHAKIGPSDTVYDLGAGSGVITNILARRCKQVIAVESEAGALSQLRQNVHNLSNVTIVPNDILATTFPGNEYKVFANIPFSLSAKIVRMLTSQSTPPKAIYLIVQKQFARKLTPGKDHFTSQLSSSIAPWFTVRIRKPLQRTDFTPPPAVDTVLLEIMPRTDALLSTKQRTDYELFIERCFSRQKYYGQLPLTKAGIAIGLRPSQLSPEEWLRLYDTSRSVRNSS